MHSWLLSLRSTQSVDVASQLTCFVTWGHLYLLLILSCALVSSSPWELFLRGHGEESVPLTFSSCLDCCYRRRNESGLA